MILFVIIITCISAVSAQDINNTAISEDSSSSLLSVDDSDSEVLTDDNSNAGSFTDLQNIIDNATANSIISLDRDYCYNASADSTCISIGKNLTINGNNHVINADNKINILRVTASNVVINNITFCNANSTSYGSAIYWSGDNGTISHCTFVNSTGAYGGSIYCKGADHKITDSTFVNSSATTGGTIYYVSKGNTTILNCRFENCNASSSGGALFWQSGHPIIINSTFVNNRANSEGGAVRFQSTSKYYAYIKNCTFINNSVVDGDAGALLIQTPNGKVIDSYFENNTSPYNGGGITWAGKNGTLINTTFVNNSAKWGGAICWMGADGSLDNSTFENNNASASGGAIYWGNSKGILTNSSFVKNTARYGGAVLWANKNGILANSSFANNSAYIAGAVYWNAANGNLYNSIFENNSAVDAGAVLWYAINGNLKNSSFKYNFAYHGGAVYWYGVNGTISYSNFTENTAEAGTLLTEGNTITIKMSNFIKNTARYAGAILIVCDDVLIDYCNFTENTATRYGGGAVNDYNFGYPDEVKYHYGHVISNSRFIGNTAKNYGGAVSLFNATVENSVFSKNSATYGGALFADYLNIKGSSFSDNTAGEGSSIYALDTADITNCEVSDSDVRSCLLEPVDVSNYNDSSLIYVLENGMSGYGFESMFYPYFPDYYASNIIYSTSEGWLDKNLSLLINSLTGEDVSEYLKILIYNYYDADTNLSSQVFTFADGDYENSDDEIVKGVLELYDSGFRVQTESAYKDLGNGSYLYYTFSVLVNPSAVQNLFVFKTDIVTLNVKKEALNKTVTVGESVEFRINVTNNCSSDIDGVFVIDENFTEGLVYQDWRSEIGNWSYNETSKTWLLNNTLKAGESVSIILIFNTASNGTLVNNASAGANDISLYNATANVTANYNVNLNITKKTDVSSVVIGDEITYTITVTNEGPSTATEIVVEDTLTGPATIVADKSIVPEGTVLENNVWTIDQLASGANVTLTLVVLTNATGNVSNNVSVSCKENPTKKTANASNVVVTSSDTNITASVTPAKPGENATVSISVTDNKGYSVDGGNVTVVLPDGSEVTVNVEDGVASVNWTVPENYTAGDYPIKVTYNGNEDYNPSNTETNITVESVVDIELSVTVDESVVDYGSVVEFTIIVKNNGINNATGVYVEITIPQGFIYIANNCTDSDYKSLKDKLCADASTQNYDSSTNIWTVGDLEVGQHAGLSILASANYLGTKSVTATASANEDETDESNNKDSANVTVNPVVDLSIEKTVDKTEIKSGNEVTYTIKVTNNGPNDATGVKVSDDELTQHTFVYASSSDYDSATGVWTIGDLANGSSVTLTVTVIINEIGTYSNTASVSSNENDSDMSNNNASCDDVNVSGSEEPGQKNTTDDDINKKYDVNDSVLHQTGNPIFMMLFVLFTTGLITLRKRD